MVFAFSEFTKFTFSTLRFSFDPKPENYLFEHFSWEERTVNYLRSKGEISLASIY